MRLPICSTVADTRFPTPPELFQVIGGAAQRARRYQNLGAYRRGARAQATTKRQGALVQTPA
jgi:hypothetical protein